MAEKENEEERKYLWCCKSEVPTTGFDFRPNPTRRINTGNAPTSGFFELEIQELHDIARFDRIPIRWPQTAGLLGC